MPTKFMSVAYLLSGLLVIAGFLFVACNSKESASPSSVAATSAQATRSSGASPRASSVAPSGNLPPSVGGTPGQNATSPATTPGQAVATLSATSGPLFVTVLEPANESVVETNSVVIKGKTSPLATVSVNDDVVDTDVAGNFTYTANLEEGPNAFDIIVSDDDENEADVTLTVFFVS